MLIVIQKQRFRAGLLSWTQCCRFVVSLVLLMSSVFTSVSGAQAATTVTSIVPSVPSVPSSSPLTLEEALIMALAVDPVLQRQAYLSAAFDEESHVMSYWPKPSVSVSAQNVPLDTLDTSQEAMTQLRLTVTQPLPQGDSLSVKRQLAQQQRVLAMFGADDQRSRLIRRVRLVWLDIERAGRSEAVIRQSLAMLEALSQVIQSRYRVATGHTQRVDLARLSVEQEAWYDRLLAWRQQERVARRKLNEFLPDTEWLHDLAIDSIPLNRQQAERGVGEKAPIAAPRLRSLLRQHPRYVLASRRVDLGSTQTELAREQDKPRWMVQGAYGYRADDTLGEDRADFISIGVGVELPWFNRGQSAHRVGAAVARKEAAVSQRDEVYRALEAETWQWLDQSEMLRQRVLRFREKQRPLLQAHIEAAETLYRQGTGDFEPVIRARLSRLEGELMQESLSQQWSQAQVELAYYLNPLAVTLATGGRSYE